MGDAILRPGQGCVAQTSVSIGVYAQQAMRGFDTRQTDQAAQLRFRKSTDIGGCEACMRRREHKFVLFFVPTEVSVLIHGYRNLASEGVSICGHFDPSNGFSTRVPEGLSTPTTRGREKEGRQAFTRAS